MIHRIPSEWLDREEPCVRKGCETVVIVADPRGRLTVATFAARDEKETAETLLALTARGFKVLSLGLREGQPCRDR